MTVMRHVVARGLQLGIVVILVNVGTVLLLRVVPGDPAMAILGEKASPNALSAMRRELGLDEPLLQQLGDAVGGLLLHADLGTSFAYQGEVTSLIGPAWVVTAALSGMTIVMSLLIGIPAGLYLAFARRSGADLGGRLLTAMMLAVPSFMVGLVLIYVVSIALGLAPAGGWAGWWPGNFEYLWLPAAALTTFLAPLVARSVRQSALETIGQPFVEAARTRGVPRRRIVFFHVLPNASLPVITLIGFNAGALLGGAVTVETVFALPGLGAQLLQAMGTRDLPVVQGIAILTAASIVVFNLLADLCNLALDPRLRSSR